MSFFTLFMAFLVLCVVGLTWFFLHYFGNPVLENPDGIAKVVGNCGDTMEIALQFRDGRVHATHHWTNGCSFSKHCVETAANLAKSKTVAELRRVNMVSIIDVVGTLPESHLHCAQLAEITLQGSLDNYLRKTKKENVSDTTS